MIFIRIAFRNLLQHRTRSLLLGGAIATVTLLLMLLQALIAGVQGTMVENAEALATGHVNIAGFYKISQTSAAPMVENYQKLVEIARKEIPEAKLIIDRVKGFGNFITEKSSIQLPIWGVSIDQEMPILGRLPVVEGNVAGMKERKTVVIFAAQAKKLGLKVGDSLTASLPTYRNMYNTMDLKVVAILQDMGIFSTFSSFMRTDDMREVFQISDKMSGQVMIYLKDRNQTSQVENHLRGAIAAAGFTLMEKESNPFWMKFERVASESWKGQRIDVTTWEDETSYLKWILTAFNALTIFLTGILLFIVTLGLMNTLWIAVRERVGEIGTLRAIGMHRRQVRTLFLWEAAILAFMATVVGVLVGSLVAGSLDKMGIAIQSESFRLFLMSETLHFRVLASDALRIIVAIVLFLVMGAWFPARKASKLNPVLAIQDSGA